MSIFKLFCIECRKSRRSYLLPLLFTAPLLVVVSGVTNISQYFSADYTNVWAAMFIQSSLVYAYYLLPLSMIIVCVMVAGRETEHHGSRKMRVLPVESWKICLAKFGILVSILILELLLFMIVFLAAGVVATRRMGITETLSVLYLLKWCLGLFLTMLPCLAVMWSIFVWLPRPLVSAGINFLLVIPSVLFANTPLWMIDPYCYSGYLVSCSLHAFTAQKADSSFPLVTFTGFAITLFIIGLGSALYRYGRQDI